MGCPRLPYPEENRSSLFVSASNFDGERKSSGKNYETFFRQYDPALGRMTGIDPMAVKYSGLSPYNYAFNDPVGLNDPSGADPYGEHSSLNYFYDANPDYRRTYAGRIAQPIGIYGDPAALAQRQLTGQLASLDGTITSVNNFHNLVSENGDRWEEQKSGSSGSDITLHSFLMTHVFSYDGTWSYGSGSGDFRGNLMWSLKSGSWSNSEVKSIQKKSLIPVDLSKTNAGDKLLQNLREVYREYRKDANVRYTLGDIIDLDTKLTPTAGGWFAGFANSTNGYRTVLGGITARFTVAHERELDGSIIPTEIGSSEPKIDQIVYRKFNRPEIRVGDKIVFRLIIYQGINIEIGGVIKSSKHAKQMQSDIHRIKSYLGN